MFEGYGRGCVQFRAYLVGKTRQRARVERTHAVAQHRRRLIVLRVTALRLATL